MGMFSHLNSITLRVTYEAQGKGSLPPYLGSTIRGLIGHSLRGMVCPTPKVKCFTCELAPDCAYANYFVSPRNAAGSVNPFVLLPVTSHKTLWEKGDVCEFEITLFGKSSKEISLMAQMFRQVGHLGWGSARIPFKLLKITNEDKLVWYNDELYLKNAMPQPLMVTERETSMVFMHFSTPLRLEKSKALIEKPSFENIIQAIARRIGLLSHAYEDFQMEWNYEAMLAEARKVKIVDCKWEKNTFRRYSMNQRNRELVKDTMTGWVCYEGDLTPFTPLLEAGKLIHIGRNSTHGFGYYTIGYK